MAPILRNRHRLTDFRNMADHNASQSAADSATESDPGAQSASHAFFPRWVNYLLPLIVLSVLGGGVYVPLVVFTGLSPQTLNSGYRPEQPVPYSHAVHVGELGMDCRYCHTTVDSADFAAIPSTQTCMNCHNPEEGEAGIHKGSNKLEPLYASYESGKPVKWVKVHDLPDHAYFNHSAHINKGVGCYSCHGRVDKMDETGVHQVQTLAMGWCLDCHRAPEQHLRPLDQVTNLGWSALDDSRVQAEGITDEKEAQLWLGELLKTEHGIHDAAYMQSCSTCHR